MSSVSLVLTQHSHSDPDQELIQINTSLFFFFFLPWHHKARAAFLLPYILYNSAITVLFRLQNLALFCFSVIWPLFII